MITFLKRAGLFGCLLAAALSVGCADRKSPQTTAENGQMEEDTKEEQENTGGKVYFLSRHPELQKQWDGLAAAFEQETGISVKITTVEEDSYDAVLDAAMQDRDIPTMFEVHTLEELEKWSGFCLNLKESSLYSEIAEDSSRFARNGDEMAGIGYLEGDSGILYNKKLLSEYCALDGSMIASADEITNFVVLKAVVEDIQNRKDELGIEGAFASQSMEEMLADMSGLLKNGADLACLESFFDLYVSHCVSREEEIGTKTGKDGAVEFALGEAVFYYGGTWSYETIGGNEVVDGDFGILPVYIGLEGEQNQGLCRRYRSYFCINKSASKEDEDAALLFLKWLYGEKKEDLAALETVEWSPVTDAAEVFREKQAVFWKMMDLEDLPLIREYAQDLAP